MQGRHLEDAPALAVSDPGEFEIGHLQYDRQRFGYEDSTNDG